MTTATAFTDLPAAQAAASGCWGQDWSSYTSATPATAGLGFFFTKVTEGQGYINPEWRSQYARGTAAGLVPGKYHYPHMGSSVTAEADYFLSHADVRPGDLLALDWEGYDAANTGVPHTEQAAFKDSFLKYLIAKAPHNPVGVYCDKDYWLNIDASGYYGHFLWIATAGLPAGSPGIKAPWLFHQYSATSLDYDYCHLGQAQLRAWAASFQTPSPAPSPVPTPVPAPVPVLESDMSVPIPPKSVWPYDWTISFPRGTKRTIGFNADNTRVGEPPAKLRVAVFADSGNFTEENVEVDSSKQTVIVFGNPAMTTGVSIFREDGGSFTVGHEES